MRLLKSDMLALLKSFILSLVLIICGACGVALFFGAIYLLFKFYEVLLELYKVDPTLTIFILCVLVVPSFIGLYKLVQEIVRPVEPIDMHSVWKDTLDNEMDMKDAIGR